MTVTTYTWMSAPDISSAAAFRKWAQGIHDAFVTCGWVQTPNTGQVDLTTAVVPTTINTPAGYQIFRLNDSLQATAPLFVKMEYGRGGSASANCLSFWLTVGRGTDGAGTITGVLFSAYQSHAITQLGTSTEYPSYASGDASSICLALWPAAPESAYPSQVAIERSRDSLGAATADSVLIAIGTVRASTQGNWTGLVRVIGYDGSDTSKCADADRLLVTLPKRVNNVEASLSSSLSKDGVTAPVLPVPCIAPGVTPWVSNMLVAVHPGDAGATSVIQAATINGQSRVYRAFPYFPGSSGIGLNYGPGLICLQKGTGLDGAQRWFFAAIAWAV